MPSPIVPSSGSGFSEKALMRTAQSEEFFDDQEETAHEPMPQKLVDRLREIHEEMSGQLVNPAIKKRQIAVNQAAKRKAMKAIYEATKGYHQKIPIDKIFDALEENGMYPIQEDGHRWEGMLLGGAQCGTEEARGQRATIDLAAKGADGKWGKANVVLSLSWCKMPSGKYEITSYVA